MPRSPKRLAIPKRLTLRGRVWTVRSMAKRSKRGPMRGLAGQCDPETRVIHIDTRETADEQGKTLVHEILHALWPEDVVAPEVEERIVRRLEGPLHALLLSGAIVPVPDEVP